MQSSLETAWSLRDVLPGVRYAQDLENLEKACPLLRGMVKRVSRVSSLLTEIEASPEEDYVHALVDVQVVEGQWHFPEETVHVEPRPIPNLGTSGRMVQLDIDPPFYRLLAPVRVSRMSTSVYAWQYNLTHQAGYDLTNVLLTHADDDPPTLVNLSFEIEGAEPWIVRLLGDRETVRPGETWVSFSDKGYPILLHPQEIHRHTPVFTIVATRPPKLFVYAVHIDTPPSWVHIYRFTVKRGRYVDSYRCMDGWMDRNVLRTYRSSGEPKHLFLALAESIPKPMDIGIHAFHEWFDANGLILQQD